MGEKCEICGKPATVNYSLEWRKYDYDSERNDYMGSEFLDTVKNEYYCDDCVEWNMYDIDSPELPPFPVPEILPDLVLLYPGLPAPAHTRSGRTAPPSPLGWPNT